MKLYPITKMQRISDDYFEVPFTEYTSDGCPIRKGTEDFSHERYNNLAVYEIWTWDGASYNQGGHRKFEKQAAYRVNGKPAELKALYAAACKYASEKTGRSIPAEISIRKI